MSRAQGRALAAQVAAVIERHPEQFFQRFAVHWLPDAEKRRLPDGRWESLGGVPAGVEGWVAAVIDAGDARPVAQRQVRKYGAGEVARRALALTDAEAERMFDPAPFGDLDEASAGDAAAMLRHYAERGVVAWIRAA